MPGKDLNPKDNPIPAQISISEKAESNNNTDQLMDMAAEQFAILFWRQWMAKKASKDKMKNH
jgi:hypothetical protein